MGQQDKGRPLPKFGEWDVNNPASAEGFTVIFAKARDEKKTNGAPGNGGAQNIHNHKQDQNYPRSPMVCICMIINHSFRILILILILSEIYISDDAEEMVLLLLNFTKNFMTVKTGENGGDRGQCAIHMD